MKNNRKILIILILAILLLVLLLTLFIKSLDINNEKDYKGDIIIDKLIEKAENVSQEDLDIIYKYDTYMENNRYLETYTNKEKKANILMIDEIIEAINEKKYDFLYKKLDPTYATAIFPKQENFEKYMEALTAGCNDFTCNYYDVQYYGYQCQLISQSQGVKFEIQMEPANNYTDYYFSPRKDLVETREKYVTFSVNGILGVIEYEFVCGDTIEYITNLKNNTNRSITCNFSESTAQVNDWGYLIESKLISPVTELSLAAGESKDVTFVFDVKSTDDLRPDFLNFICKVGENTKTARVYISSYEDDIGI